MDLLERLFNAGVLNRVDLEFARLLGRISSVKNEKALLVPALASRAPRVGEVCVDLNTVNESIKMDLVETEDDIEIPSKEEILSAINGVKFIGKFDDKGKPVPIIREKDRFYLYKYYRDEINLARMIVKRLKSASKKMVDSSIIEDLKHMNSDDVNRIQSIFKSSSLLLLTGGPGTGKTTRASKIIELFIKNKILPDRIGVVAPTGRAAARIEEVISINSKQIPINEIKPMTIHRRFGIHPDRPFFAKYNPSNPMDIDLLVIDEASMVDLVTMTRIFEGLPEDCFVIIIGDPDQLTSVQAGSVLADLCRSSIVNKRGLLRLTKRYRFDETIGKCADLINRGEEGIEEFFKFIRGPLDNVEYIEQVASTKWMDNTINKAIDVYKKLMVHCKSGDVEKAIEIISKFRFLTALRKGRYGCEAINDYIKTRLGESRSNWFAGRLIIVTENDPDRGLFNGDLGVAINIGEKTRVVFPGYSRINRKDGEEGREEPRVRYFDPYNLPAFEDAFATTIHKAQGSEAEEVVLLFPPNESPILSREILYTGVTRAKKRLTISGNREILTKCIMTPIKRASGLREKMDGN